MCTPAAAVGLIVANGIFQYAAQDDVYDQNYSDALATQQLQLQDNFERGQEIDDEAEAARSEIAIEALKKRGQVRVATGENMGMGLTTQLLLQDVYAQEGRESAAVDRDRSKRQRQNAREKEAILQGTRNRINSIQQPSLVGTGLQIAGGIAGSETASSAFKSKPKST